MLLALTLTLHLSFFLLVAVLLVPSLPASFLLRELLSLLFRRVSRVRLNQLKPTKRLGAAVFHFPVHYGQLGADDIRGGLR